MMSTPETEEIRLTPRRRSARMLLLLAIVTSMLVAVAGRADAGGDNPAADEAQFVALVNQTRAAVGVAPLAVDGQLTALARQHAQAMADKGTIFHASPISAGVTAPWIKLGENVGTGPSAPPIMDAFINSPKHYQNIVDPAFTYIGVGVVWVGNQMFTCIQPTHREPAPNCSRSMNSATIAACRGSAARTSSVSARLRSTASSASVMVA